MYTPSGLARPAGGSPSIGRTAGAGVPANRLERRVRRRAAPGSRSDGGAVAAGVRRAVALLACRAERGLALLGVCRLYCYGRDDG
jgi:hypothetical protein